MVFQSSEEIAGPMICFTFFVAGIMLLMISMNMRNQGLLLTIRDVATQHHPVFSLSKGQRWHLFLRVH